MLLLTASSNVPRRLQAPWVSEEEVREVVRALAAPGRPDRGRSWGSRASTTGPRRRAVDDDDDELLVQARDLVVRSQLGSTSMLQRKLRVGFARAGRLMDLLEQAGVVGPSEGSKARAVLMTPEELDAPEPEVSAETAAPLMVAPFRLDSLREHAARGPATAPSVTGRRRPVHSHRRRRRRRVAGAARVARSCSSLAAGGAFVGVRLRAADPPPAVTPVAGAAPCIVPARRCRCPGRLGQGAVAVPSIGVDVASGPEKPVPVASLTKLMTAYVDPPRPPAGREPGGADDHGDARPTSTTTTTTPSTTTPTRR